MPLERSRSSRRLSSLGRADERLRVAQRISLGIQILLAEDSGGLRRTSDSAVFHQSGIRQRDAGLPLHEFDKLAARHQWECGLVHHPSFGFANFAEVWRSMDDKRCITIHPKMPQFLVH